MILTNARLAMQSEDDDVQAYEVQHGRAAAEAMSMLDKPILNAEDIAAFFQQINWRHTLNVAFNPGFDYWIEPVLRLLCYRLASLHTAIWHPFEKRLADQYGVPTLVVPPVASGADFDRIPLSTEERSSILSRHGIDDTNIVFFLGGALYPFSNEYSIFLAALNLAFEKTGRKMALVISSGAGRPKLPIESMALECLHPQISFTHLGKVNDIGYTEMLKASDIVCSPGIPDTFNKFRLPSRLVKAMAMAKPILTCRCGFGESLENEFNAFLTDGDDPTDWAITIAGSLDLAKREFVGNNGRHFAEKYFNSDRVAGELKKKFEAMMVESPRGLGDGILHGAADRAPVDSSQMCSMAKAFPADRYRSSMQDAIHLIKLLAKELGTVVHLGAGKGGELENYCRLGAKQITLVEPLPELAESLKKLESHHGKIKVIQKAVAGESGVHQAYVCRNIRPNSNGQEELYLSKPSALLSLRPSLQVIRTESVETCTISEICENLWFSGRNDLLILEIQGLEVEALKATPIMLIRQFEWIAVRVSELPLFENGSTLSLTKKTLQEYGFKYIPSVKNFSGTQVAALFRKRPFNSN
jgi:FkbM family methyltransferase